jgi:hypothetical protein
MAQQRIEQAVISDGLMSHDFEERATQAATNGATAIS